jgi:hypothetical protein
MPQKTTEVGRIVAVRHEIEKGAPASHRLIDLDDDEGDVSA